MFTRGDRVQINEAQFPRTPWTKHPPARRGIVLGFACRDGKHVKWSGAGTVYVRWDGNKIGAGIDGRFLLPAPPGPAPIPEPAPPPPPRIDGRRNNHRPSRLTPAQVEDVNRRRQAGERLRSLAREFGLSVSRMSRICKGW